MSVARTHSVSAGGSVSHLPTVSEPIHAKGYDGVFETRPRKLTTAESLIVELVVAHHALGKPYTALAGELWITPQLDSLEHLGFVEWSFDLERNYRIVPRPPIFGLEARSSP